VFGEVLCTVTGITVTVVGINYK